MPDVMDIILRAPEPGDVDAMYLLENDPALWNDGVTFAPLSRKQLWDYVDTYDGNIFATGQLRLVIETVTDGRFAGVIDLYDFDRINRRAYVGITVIKSMRGHGVGAAALRWLCQYAAEMLDMNQLAAVVREDNRPSVRLFESNGFTVTGRFPAWIKRGDDWVDAVHMQRSLKSR